MEINGIYNSMLSCYKTDMKEKKALNKKSVMGRPKKEMSLDLIKSMIEIGATQEEIAFCLHCSVDTIENFCKENDTTYSDIYKKHNSTFKISIRRMQLKSASEGSIPMQIWLGKQYLGQRDRTEADTNIKLNGGVSIFEQMQKENESENTDKTKSE